MAVNGPAIIDVGGTAALDDNAQAVRRRRTVDLGCTLALCIAVLLTWIPRWNGPIDIRWDGATYFVLGTSLSEGKGYRLLSEPGDIRANQYPPLLPAIVAVHEKVLHSTDPVRVGIWLRRTWMLFSIFYIAVAFRLGRLLVPAKYAVWLAAVALMNFDTFFYETLCFTELPFALATVLFVWLYLRNEGKSWTRYLAPVFAIAAYLLRSMGITLLVAWILESLFRKRFRSAVLRTAMAAVPVIAWQWYVHDVETGADYKHPYYAYQRDPSMFYNVSYAVNMHLKDPFNPDSGSTSVGDLCYRVIHNTMLLPYSLGQSLVAREGFFIGHINAVNTLLGARIVRYLPIKAALYALGLITLFGVVRLILRGQTIIGLTTMLTLGAICTSPWPGQFGRYLSPMLPLLLLSLMAAVGIVAGRSAASAKWKNGKAAAFRAVVFSLILAECGLALISGIRNFLSPVYYNDGKGNPTRYHLVYYLPDYADVKAMLSWLLPKADSHAVIAAVMPEWFYLQSGLKTVMPPLTRKAAKAQAQADSVPVSYVVIEHLLVQDNFNNFFPNLVESSPDKWKLLYSAPGKKILLYGRIGVARLNGQLLTD
jgi:hypothetical protein